MKLTQIDLAEGRGGSQREVSASEAVARAEEACGGTLLLFEPDGVPRAAVAICPGGGFGKVNTEHEGVAFAEWFVAHGIAAGVVKYRLPEGDPALPQQDVERAAELLHNRFDGVKTGVLGASIGGYLAACAALAQPAARRPDFQLLFYPVVSMEEEFAHRPSMLRMFGRELHGLEAKRRSPLYRIDRAAPPAFLAAAKAPRLQDSIAETLDKAKAGGKDLGAKLEDTLNNQLPQLLDDAMNLFREQMRQYDKETPQAPTSL